MPQNAAEIQMKEWWLIYYITWRSESVYILDRRRRKRTTALDLAERMRSTPLYRAVWIKAA